MEKSKENYIEKIMAAKAMENMTGRKEKLSPDVKKEVSWMHLRLLWKKEVLHLKKYRGESMSIR